MAVGWFDGGLAGGREGRRLRKEEGSLYRFRRASFSPHPSTAQISDISAKAHLWKRNLADADRIMYRVFNSL